jgi:hypothetical protein
MAAIRSSSPERDRSSITSFFWEKIEGGADSKLDLFVRKIPFPAKILAVDKQADKIRAIPAAFGEASSETPCNEGPVAAYLNKNRDKHAHKLGS